MYTPICNFFSIMSCLVLETFGKQRLVLGTKDSIWLLQYEELGKHNISQIPTTLRNMTAMAYNSLNNSLFISDASTKSLVEMKIPNGKVTYLPYANSFGYISAMAFGKIPTISCSFFIYTSSSYNIYCLKLIFPSLTEFFVLFR